VTRWRRTVTLVASFCDLAAGTVTTWWSLPGQLAGLLFALFFLTAGVMLMAATFKSSLRLLVAALVLTVIGELEPAGGAVASAVLKEPLGLGAVLPLGAAALSIVAIAIVLLRDRSSPHTRPS
jgi:hypothetical protein